MKAQFKGTCQCCGAIQKLPDGLLANHGYQVKWNMFNGICIGSKEQPYEKSCHLLRHFKEVAEKQIKNIIEFQSFLNERATTTKGWVRNYDTVSYKYVWLEVEIKEDRTYIDNRGNDKKLPVGDFYDDDLLDTCTKLNKIKAFDLNKEINNLKEYILWQERRIKNWELKDLISI